jgi:hypothetical protein
VKGYQRKGKSVEGNDRRKGKARGLVEHSSQDECGGLAGMNMEKIMDMMGISD